MESIQDQEVFIMIGIGIFIMLSMAIVLVMFYGRTQQKILNQKLATQELVLQKTILAQEEERSRIAKDLHDEIGSKLNVVFLHVQRIKKMIGQTHISDKTNGTLNELTNVLNTTISTTRRISHELLPPTLDKFGLAEAMKELCDGFSATGFLDTDLRFTSGELRIEDKMTALNVFRILQEMLNNSIRHGKATHVAIHFSQAADGLDIRYEDNGKGFDMAEQKKRTGLGMSNIESRLKMVGGSWEYMASPGNGLKAKIRLQK